MVSTYVQSINKLDKGCCITGLLSNFVEFVCFNNCVLDTSIYFKLVFFEPLSKMKERICNNLSPLENPNQ